jgi:hypothetical protein
MARPPLTKGLYNNFRHFKSFSFFYVSHSKISIDISQFRTLCPFGYFILFYLPWPKLIANYMAESYRKLLAKAMGGKPVFLRFLSYFEPTISRFMNSYPGFFKSDRRFKTANFQALFEFAFKY